MTTTTQTLNNFPTLGTSPLALVGCDINMYVYSARWLYPIKRYIDSDHILPSRTRFNDLPGNAFVIKASAANWNPKLKLPNGDTLPKFFQLLCTAGRQNNSWGGYVPRLSYNLGFISKEEWENQQHYRSGGFVASKEDHLDLIFKDTDSDYTVIPRMSINRGSAFLLGDIQRIALAQQYLLKLFKIGFNLHYDEATNRWLEQGICI